MNIVKAVSVIIGTIIGAGFASGKEIYIFFGQYGKFGSGRHLLILDFISLVYGLFLLFQNGIL